MDSLVELTMCRLCLSSVTRENFHIIDNPAKNILGILLPKWNLEEGKHLICNDCSTKLFAAFDFKEICLNTENCIFPYVNSDEGGMIDLREIYFKENDSKLPISEFQNVCRLCMQLIFGEFICFEQLDVNMLNTYLPGINFSTTKNPVICKACYEAFKSHSVFLTICLENEREIKFVNQGFCYLKTEEIDLKTEKVDIKNEEVVLKSEKVDIKTEELDLKPEEIDLKIEESDKSDVEETAHETEKMCDFEIDNKLQQELLMQKNASEIDMYRCDECSFSTKHKKGLYRHVRSHRDSSKHQTHKCNECSFTTKRKPDLFRHQLVHKDPSEIVIYKCDQCSYATKRKSDLLRHQDVHRDPSEIQMYQCDECSYKAKQRYSVNVHKLIHRDPSEIQMYQCDECSYTTRRYKYLRNHKLIHTKPSKIQIYKCEDCPRQFNYRNGLRYHKLRGCVDGRDARRVMVISTPSTDVGGP